MLAYKYIAEWMLGRPKQARETNDLCVTLAKDIGHPPSVGFALTAKTGWCYFEGDAEKTLKSADAALVVAREERLGFWEPMISVFRGWAVSELDERADGVAQIRDALERYRKNGNGVQQVWMNMILADAQWKAGHCDDAFRTLAETMRLAKENGEGLFEPELYRLEGEFRFQQATGAARGLRVQSSNDRMTATDQAERCIRESLDRARRQGARMLELRSLVSLCEMQSKSRSNAPEYAALMETYNAFTEGFDTSDLVKARDMLKVAGLK
jgi:adenylate cyclase